MIDKYFLTGVVYHNFEVLVVNLSQYAILKSYGKSIGKTHVFSVHIIKILNTTPLPFVAKINEYILLHNSNKENLAKDVGIL